MTREEILVMEPGRLLDYFVSVNVMGGVPWGPFQPSAEIEDAWKLVEIITRKSELEQCGPIVELTHDGVWHMKIGRTQAQGKTAPEAICKATLLAVIERNDEES